MSETDKPTDETVEQVTQTEQTEQPDAAADPKPESKKAAARRIADQLEEKDSKPRKQITMIVQRAGIEFSDSVLEEVEKIEAEGGMMIENGERRRTKGGVFFYLARQRLPEDVRDDIFSSWRSLRKKRQTYESQFPSFEFDERGDVVEALLADDRGELSDVRITLTGRPGKIDRREHLVITTMDYQAGDKLTLPTGVPDFPTDKVTYVVYVSAKQWEKVAKAIENPHDSLIVDGLCAFDDEIEQFAVYTTQITTKKLQRKLRKQDRQQEGKPLPNKNDASKPEAKQKDAPKAEAKPKKKKKRDDRLQMPEVDTALPAVELDLPDSVPTDVAQELAKLHTAALTYRQKIEKMEENPDKNKFMLTTTRRLLKNTEKQISELEQANNISE